MSTGQIILLVCVVTFGDLILVGGLLYAASSTLREFGAKFPGVPAREGAVRKEFQSFKFGIMSMGASIHATVDEDHLHLDPAWIARKLGMRRVSVPWGAIEYKGEFLRTSRVRIAGEDVSGPTWALGMAKR